MIHVTVVYGPLPFRDKDGIANPNYRMVCLCGRTVNIAGSGEFAEQTRQRHLWAAHIARAVPTDPFEGL